MKKCWARFIQWYYTRSMFGPGKKLLNAFVEEVARSYARELVKSLVKREVKLPGCPK